MALQEMVLSKSMMSEPRDYGLDSTWSQSPDPTSPVSEVRDSLQDSVAEFDFDITPIFLDEEAEEEEIDTVEMREERRMVRRNKVVCLPLSLGIALSLGESRLYARRKALHREAM